MYTIGQRKQLTSQSDARQWKEHHIEPSGNKLNYTHDLDYYWYLSLRMCKKINVHVQRFMQNLSYDDRSLLKPVDHLNDILATVRLTNCPDYYIIIIIIIIL